MLEDVDVDVPAHFDWAAVIHIIFFCDFNFHVMHCYQETIQDFQVSVLQVSDGPYDERYTSIFFFAFSLIRL